MGESALTDGETGMRHSYEKLITGWCNLVKDNIVACISGEH